MRIWWKWGDKMIEMRWGEERRGAERRGWRDDEKWNGGWKEWMWNIWRIFFLIFAFIVLIHKLNEQRSEWKREKREGGKEREREIFWKMYQGYDDPVPHFQKPTYDGKRARNHSQVRDTIDFGSCAARYAEVPHLSSTPLISTFSIDSDFPLQLGEIVLWGNVITSSTSALRNLQPANASTSSLCF